MEKVDPYKVFSTPEYWAGNIGYRPGADGIGYRDFLQSNLPRVDYIASKRPGKVLDMGCGFGYLVRHLQQRGIDAWGIDISSIAMERAPAEVKPFLIQGSIAKLPFPDQSVDMSVSFGVLEHLTLEDAEACCGEIKRVSHRGIHAIGLSTELSAHLPKEQLDKTHRTLKDFYWWKERLGEKFEISEGADESWRLANQFKVMVIAPMAFPVGLSGYGGIERLAFLLSRELARRGIDVSVAAGDGSHTAPGVNLIPTGKTSPQDYVNLEYLAFSILRPTIENYNVILDLSHGKWAGRLLPYHCRTLNPIWHAPTLMQPPEPLYNVAALSSWQADNYLAFQGRRARVLDVHILDDFQAQGTTGDRFLVVGKVNLRKGTLEAVQMCRELGDPLDIVGPLGEDPAYNQRVLALCRNGIAYHGELPQRSVLELAAQAKALIYPLQEDEAHSHKSVDAQSQGCPVIVYNRSASAEYVEHGVTGFVSQDGEQFKAYMREAEKLDRAEIKRRAWDRWGAQAVGDRLMPELVEVSRGARW